MLRRPPRVTLSTTLVPSTMLFRSRARRRPQVRPLVLFPRGLGRGGAARARALVVVERAGDRQFARLAAIVATATARLGFGALGFGALGRFDRGEAARGR